MGPSTPQQQWGSPQAAVPTALFPQQQQTLSYGWSGNPQVASNVQPGVMPQQPQPPDTADFFRRYFSFGVNGNPKAMQ